MLDIFRSWRSTSGIKLLSGLLKYNPEERWTAEEALNANYFSEMVCEKYLVTECSYSNFILYMN